MQVKVQTVSELTINQLSDDQYKAEKAAGRINAGEVYACTPSPVKWEDIQNKPDVSGGGDGDKFYQWLKERNYDLTNFQGLEGVFPVKAFPEIKAANLAGGDTKIIGTGAPNTIVEYDGTQAQVGNDGHFVLEGITPLTDGDLIQITYYDYAGRKKTFAAAVGKIEYAVPEGTTEITKDTVAQYNLNRAGRLIFPASVKSIAYSAFQGCANLTSVSFPACTSVESSVFDGCSSLTSVYLPAGTSMGSYAFNECAALTSVSLPSCTSVKEYAFRDCTALTSVSFPSCTSMGDRTFLRCNKLQTVILSDGWVPSEGPDIPKTATVYNPDKTKKVNWNTMSWVRA